MHAIQRTLLRQVLYGMEFLMEFLITMRLYRKDVFKMPLAELCSMGLFK